MTTVGIYTRLSHDATGEQTATARQERACRAFAEVRGWEVVEVFEDVDLSAYQPRVIRPSYERLLKRVGDGALDGVLVWKLDRLVRRPSEFERFWSVCEKTRVFIASAMEPIDASTDLGVALVRILVTFAQLESATISVRIKAKHRELAEQGKAVGVTPYGWKHGMQELEPEEAALLREAVERVLAGDSCTGIARDWYRRGVRSRRGKPMATARVREMLTAPRMVGDRLHRGEIVNEGCFAPVIDRDTYAQLRAALSSRAVWNNPTVHELTGLLRCGRCGGRMYRRDAARRSTYTCAGSKPYGCGACCITAEPLEAFVRGVLLDRVKSLPPAVPAVVDPGEIADLLDAHAVALRALATRRGITAGERNALQAELVGELQRRTGHALFEGRATPASGWRDAQQLETSWPTMSVVDRRAVLATHLHYIVIHPVGPGTGSRFRSERVQPVFWWSEKIPGQNLRRIAAAWSPSTPPPSHRKRGSARRWTDKQLISAVRSFAETTESPSAKLYELQRRANPELPSLTCITRRLGSWTQALRRAGRMLDEPMKPDAPTARRYTDVDILRRLREWLAAGGDGRVESYASDRTGTDWPSHSTIYLRFGSWGKALAAVEQSPAGRRWTREEVEDAVCRWLRYRSQHGRTSADYARSSAGNLALPSLQTVVANLGSWNDALRLPASRRRSDAVGSAS